jgi:signal transduction histidine kinase
MWSRSEVGEGKTAVSFLAVYRGFALVVAVSLLFSTGYFRGLSWPGWTLVGIAGVYTLFKLLYPSSRYKKSYFTYSAFGFDLALCLSLPMFTGGLHSPFLLYSLCPLLTAALVFPKKLTFSIAGLPFLAVVASQQIIYGVSIVDSFNPPGLAFSLLAVYLVGAFLFAWLPYVMNIRESQNIKAKAVVEERSRLSRDIHDGLAQALSVIRWKVQLMGKTIVSGNKAQSLNELAEITELLDATQYEARVVIDQLRTNIKGDKGFVPTLAQYATDFARQYGTRCELRVSDGMVKLSSLAELEMLYVAQEALNNIRKHADASVVHLSLESTSDGIEMAISDNGRGFDPDVGTGGHGLPVMEERVRSVGGQLSIKSSPGQGTKINVKLPPAPEL